MEVHGQVQKKPEKSVAIREYAEMLLENPVWQKLIERLEEKVEKAKDEMMRRYYGTPEHRDACKSAKVLSELRDYIIGFVEKTSQGGSK